MKRASMQLLFAAVLALASASAAQAFTFESSAPGDSGAARQYVDPTDKFEPKGGSVSRLDSGSEKSAPKDGLSIQFGGQESFDQKFNSNDMFNPLKR